MQQCCRSPRIAIQTSGESDAIRLDRAPTHTNDKKRFAPEANKMPSDTKQGFEGAASRIASICVMAIVSRLQWVRRQIVAATDVHIAFSSASPFGRGKVKIVLSNRANATSTMAKGIALQGLAAVIRLAGLYSVTDRGHTHSNGDKERLIYTFKSWDFPRSS